MNAAQHIRLTVVYDNNPFKGRLAKDWGFSCFIEGLEKSILFDTGRNGQTLLSNLEQLCIRPEEIDLIFLSHAHRDHTDGLADLLNKKTNVEVWLPGFFPAAFKDSIRTKGARVVEVEDFQNICEGAYTTGVISGWIKEQSLVLDFERGLIIITGCAHPKIVKIISAAKDLLNKNVYMACGGFHLAGYQEKEMREILTQFRSLGVKKVAPCHCSGNESRSFFAKEYNDDYIEIGVGKVIEAR